MVPRRPSGPPRRRRKEQPRSELLVLVEGTKTEDGYLLPLRRDLRDQVIVTVDTRGGVPLTLVQRAVAAKREAEREFNRGRGRAYDAVWCMFDRDVHPNVAEALALANEHGVHVVMSNPCIELWFILHFKDQTAAIDRHSAQRGPPSCSGAGRTSPPLRPAAFTNCTKMPALVPRHSTANTTLMDHPNAATRAATSGDSSTTPARCIRRPDNPGREHNANTTIVHSCRRAPTARPESTTEVALYQDQRR